MKIQNYFVFMALLLFFGNVFGKSFEKYLGSTGVDYGYYIQQTSDDGYVVTGKTDSNPSKSTNIFLAKFNSDGSQQWYKTFGGRDVEWGKSVKQTKDGGYIITGWTASYATNGNYDLWIVKTDSDGNEEWNKVVKTYIASDGLDIEQTIDGGYVVVGEVAKAVNNQGIMDAWLLKIDSNGNTEWSKKFGGNQRDVFFEVELTSDNGYVCLGYTVSNSSDNKRDYWIVKTDSLGNMQWNENYDGIGGDDWGRRIRQTDDDGYIFTGASNDPNDHFQIMLVKTNSSGEEEWRKNYGGQYSAQGRGLDITSDGNFILSGSIDHYKNGNTNGWLLKVDNNGDILWDKQFGTRSNIADLEYVQQCEDGGFICTGKSFSSSTQSDYMLIKVNKFGTVSVEENQLIFSEDFNLSQNYPNPFNPTTKINYIIPKSSHVSLAIYNSQGNKIEELVNKTQSEGSYEISWDASGIPSGVYFYKIITKDFTEMRKCLFIK